MSDVIKIEMSPNVQETLNRLKDTRGALTAAARAMDEENQYTVSHIQAKYLSFPKGSPATLQGLRVQTNRLRSSIRASRAVVVSAGATDAMVRSGIGSNVKYAAAHEFGATIPPHDIVGKNGGMLRFKIGDRVIFRRKVHHPGSTLPERAPIRRGIRDRAADYSRSMGDAVVTFMGGSAA